MDPGVATLIRGGSIPYPRVASTSPTVLFTVPEEETITQANFPPPPPPPLDTFKVPPSVSRSSGTRSRAPSRSLKDETVISRYGSLVFHNYRPSSAASSNSPSLRVNGSTNGTASGVSERLPKHRAREVQQAELLHLVDAAQVHRRLGQEICQLKGRPPHKIAQITQPNAGFQSVVIAPQSIQSAQLTQMPASHNCLVFSGPAHSIQQAMANAPLLQTSSSPSPSLPPPPAPQLPQPPISHKYPTQIFSGTQIFGNLCKIITITVLVIMSIKMVVEFYPFFVFRS